MLPNGPVRNSSLLPVGKTLRCMKSTVYVFVVRNRKVVNLRIGSRL